jgi:hypothetical protein
MPLNLRRAIAALFVFAIPTCAAADPPGYGAFAIAIANGSIVRSAPHEVVLVGTIVGPLFMETSDGPVDAGRVACTASMRIDQAADKQTGSGVCAFTAPDNVTAWGEWRCTGAELMSCRGTIKFTGGTGRLAGFSSESPMTWRPSAHDLKKQLDGTVLQNTTGVLVWRDFLFAK